MTAQPLARVTSIKVKLGVLVAASVIVALAVAALGGAGGVPMWLSVPVTILLALAKRKSPLSVRTRHCSARSRRPPCDSK